MATLTLQGTLKNAFAEEFSNTIIQYASGSALFCDTLLQIIDSDIHAVNLTKFLNNSVLNCCKSADVQDFLVTCIANIMDLGGVESAWFQYYLPRVYVFFHTTTFSGKRLDRDSLSLLFDHLNNSGRIERSLLNRSVSEGDKQLTLFSRKCKDDDWYYDINDVLDTVEAHITRKTKQNTISLFMTIVKAIAPKFIDDLRSNFGRRMSLSFMLGMNRLM
jgi:hypothetical protein